jgi:Na+-transporting methylmalonyl-CoA/oxaloacetate decarboxylase gamma subunit
MFITIISSRKYSYSCFVFVFVFVFVCACRMTSLFIEEAERIERERKNPKLTPESAFAEVQIKSGEKDLGLVRCASDHSEKKKQISRRTNHARIRSMPVTWVPSRPGKVLKA